MNLELQIELSPSDRFELKRWVEEMRQGQLKASYGVQFNRLAGCRHDFEARLSLLEKIYKGVKDDAR